VSESIDKSTWEKVKFGELAQSITERVDDPASCGMDRYVGLEHLDPECMTIKRWDAPEAVTSTKLKFQPGDVIFGRRRAYQKKVACADFSGICSAHALVLRARPERMLSEFLPVFMSSDAFLDRAVQISVGSLSPTVNWGTLAQQGFLVPPIDEQKRIADLLWSAESHLDSLQGLTASSAASVNSTFLHEHVSSPLTTYLLADVLVSYGSGCWGASDRTPAAPLAARVLRNGDIKPDGKQDGYADRWFSEAEMERSLAKRGDIIMTSSGDVGKALLVEDTGLCASNFTRLLRVNQEVVHPRYLWLLLHTAGVRQALRRHSGGSTLLNLLPTFFTATQIGLPPLKRQEEIVQRVASASSCVDAVRFERDHLAELRSQILSSVAPEAG
jgi:type I restriction enzyme S subunit